MEGANIVLGVQWLETLGMVTTDYKNMIVEFSHQGKSIKLQGGTLALISNGGFKRMMGREEIVYLCHLQAQSLEDKGPSKLWPELHKVLQQSSQVMEVPMGLPPWRPIDHQILMNPGTKPINIHPYHYPHFQKSEMEGLTKEMLNQGLIRHSMNPFSSLEDMEILCRLLCPKFNYYP